MSDADKENLNLAKAAQKQLQKLMGGRGGAANQLLSNNAPFSNPTELAKSLTSNSARGHHGQPLAAHYYIRHDSTLSILLADAKTAKQAAMNLNIPFYTHPRRMGCTKDVKEMYLKTKGLIPMDEKELQVLLNILVQVLNVVLVEVLDLMSAFNLVLDLVLELVLEWVSS